MRFGAQVCGERCAPGHPFYDLKDSIQSNPQTNRLIKELINLTYQQHLIRRYSTVETDLCLRGS